MADTKIVISENDIDTMIDDYAKQRAYTAKISVELSGVNEPDTLLLLRTMQKKAPSVDDLAPICEAMLDGRSISFVTDNGEHIHPIVYNRGTGNALHLMFEDAPYLYDRLQQVIYALLLKKLTPRLASSN